MFKFTIVSIFTYFILKREKDLHLIENTGTDNNRPFKPDDLLGLYVFPTFYI